LKHDQGESWLKRLCRSGKLNRSEVGDDESSFLSAMTEWGIAYSLSDQHIALKTDLQLIDAEQLETDMTSVLGSRFKCHYRLVTRSTNTDVLDYYERFHRPCVAIAEMQTAGKGRRGNHWVSPFARNIYCTIGVPKRIRAHILGLLSIVTGIALCRALEACGVGGVQVKWPNDLYFQRQKLGGILIESKPLGTDEYLVAIGFGINVKMSAEDLAAIPQAATSIELINSDSLSRSAILLEAIEQVVVLIDSFDETEIPWLIDEFNAHDALQGQRICATTAERSIYGLNAGIDSTGQLQLDTEQGRQTFSAAEISLRGVY